MKLVSPFFTFPPVGWWLYASRADTILFEKHEHYQKMSDRNRYRISGSNNSILLSVPLVNGRNQDTPIADVRIMNTEKWQVRHWRTIVSVYNRSPYFFHYEELLRPLYEQEYASLIDFNEASLRWVRKQLGLGFEIEETTEYLKTYPPGHTDIRGWKYDLLPEKEYYQVFADRIGFVRGLSILDLLFSEGPRTGAWLVREGIKG